MRCVGSPRPDTLPREEGEISMITHALAVLLATPALAQTLPPPAAPARLEHIALDVADLAKSVAFYRSLFGLREIPATVTGPRWLDLGRGVQLHLIPGRTAPVADNRKTHLALAVPDVDALMIELRRRNIPFTDFFGAPGKYTIARSNGAKQIFVADPDGYWIEVNDQVGAPR